jgi:hypothetical protein
MAMAAEKKMDTPAASSGILYVDHANHLSPLTLTYHATASRHLTSGRTDVIPPSTSVEVDSAYCPRCLIYRDAASVSMGFCQVDLDSGGPSSVVSCKDCPVCFSPLAVSIDAVSPDCSASDSKHLVCHYLCGNCNWSSRECGVTSNADQLMDFCTDPSDPSKESELEKQRQVAIVETSKQLELCLTRVLDDKNKSCEGLFQCLSKMWSQAEQDEERRRRLGLETSSERDVGNVSKGQTWSLELLEQSLETKKKTQAASYYKKQSNILSDDDEKDSHPVAEGSINATPQQIAAQMTITTKPPRFRSDLLPLPVPFRARVSRRCLAEQSAGKTGILVKPKLNPLEGDSSLRAGHGQWFKKDSSATNSVPRVQICQYGMDSMRQKFAVLVKVRNPTLNMIRLRFSSPALPCSDDSTGTGDHVDFIAKQELQNIPMDPFDQTFVNASVCLLDATKSLPPADWLVIESAEDLYLDMGKGQEEDPSEVQDWNASTVLSSLDNQASSKFRVLTTRKDTAWVEMVLLTDSAADDDDFVGGHVAIPFGMQIEIGNGSWDASLIKRQDLPEGEIDIATLNLVALVN